MQTGAFCENTVDRWVVRFAGFFILASVALAYLHSPHWLWLTAFVGANLLQASFTGFCPLGIVLRRMGIAKGEAGNAGYRPAS